jgi:hypothetical protein
MPRYAPELRQLAKRLYRRRGKAVIVPFVEVTYEDWKPQHNDCHTNVNMWVLTHDGCNAIRGWVYFAKGRGGYPRFVPHSVVETEDGKLIDITPTLAAQRYPFLPHVGREGDFLRLIDKHKLIYLDYTG